MNILCHLYSYAFCLERPESPFTSEIGFLLFNSWISASNDGIQVCGLLAKGSIFHIAVVVCPGECWFVWLFDYFRSSLLLLFCKNERKWKKKVLIVVRFLSHKLSIITPQNKSQDKPNAADLQPWSEAHRMQAAWLSNHARRKSSNNKNMREILRLCRWGLVTVELEIFFF